MLSHFFVAKLKITCISQGGNSLNSCSRKVTLAQVQKQLVGERLFPAISKHQPELAGKIAGKANLLMGCSYLGASVEVTRSNSKRHDPNMHHFRTVF